MSPPPPPPAAAGGGVAGDRWPLLLPPVYNQADFVGQKKVQLKTEKVREKEASPEEEDKEHATVA